MVQLGRNKTFNDNSQGLDSIFCISHSSEGRAFINQSHYDIRIQLDQHWWIINPCVQIVLFSGEICVVERQLLIFFSKIHDVDITIFLLNNKHFFHA